ncbi:MAG: hypothetical protein V2A73_18090 [Pseudomonadota bacterium]
MELIAPWLLCIGLPLVGLLAACQSKGIEESYAELPEVEGTACIPAEARVIVGIDPARLLGCPAVPQLLRYVLPPDDGEAFSAGKALLERCGVDVVRDLNRVLVGLAGSSLGEQIVVAARGRLDEKKLVGCLRDAASRRGQGSFGERRVSGVRAYVSSSSHIGDLFLTFQSSTIILATSEDLLRRARDPLAEKASQGVPLAALAEKVDRSKDFWVVGEVPRELGEKIVEATAGAVAAPPVAVGGHLGCSTDGLVAELAVRMTNVEDARALVRFAKGQLRSLVVVMHEMGLALMNRVELEANSDMVTISFILDSEEMVALAGRIEQRITVEK